MLARSNPSWTPFTEWTYISGSSNED
jgi:hypothetical protein